MESVAALVRQAAHDFAARPVIWRKGPDKKLVPETYAELLPKVETVAAALIEAGVERGECVVLLSENRPEWVYADLGILTCGAVTVPLYPSLPAEQVQPLIARVRARTVIVEDQTQLAKLDAQREALPSVARIYVLDAAKMPADHPLARPFSELVESGAACLAARRDEIEQRVAALTGDDLATIIFTSGTTGVPKGAELTHGNFVSNIEGTVPRIDIGPEDQLLVFLPLSHVFQRMVTYLGIHCGASCLFNDGLRHLLPDMLTMRPTVMIVVPRMMEMFRDRIVAAVRSKEGLHKLIAEWALQVGDQVARAYQVGREPRGWLRFQQRLAETQVFSAMREGLGLDRLRFMVSGGAALPVDVGRWFYGIGVRVVQGYGLTETSPVVSLNYTSRGRFRFECIGAPLDNLEVRLAPDGELLVRGPSIMRGYFEMPDETAEAIDAEGWFHTGDLAEQDPDRQLRITDRKKNIMVLANGKNVAPVAIESRLQESPLIARAMVVGDGQNTVSGLLVPDFEALYAALSAQGSAPERDADNAWVEGERAVKAVRAEMDRLQAVLAPFEQVRRFTLLRRDFSLEREEMTPTLKLRRKIIIEHFAAQVAAMAD
jgi:long-chain acyl-CoA synthetase